MAKRESYYPLVFNEWIPIVRRGFRFQCCDCALVHDIDFRDDAEGKLEARFRQNGKATAGARSKFRFSKEDE